MPGPPQTLYSPFISLNTQQNIPAIKISKVTPNMGQLSVKWCPPSDSHSSISLAQHEQIRFISYCSWSPGSISLPQRLHFMEPILRIELRFSRYKGGVISHYTIRAGADGLYRPLVAAKPIRLSIYYTTMPLYLLIPLTSSLH